MRERSRNQCGKKEGSNAGESLEVMPENAGCNARKKLEVMWEKSGKKCGQQV